MDKDERMLSIGTVVTEQSDRYRIHHPYTRDWNLEIRSVRIDDTGLYQCIIGTNPRTIKTVQLIVEGRRKENF